MEPASPADRAGLREGQYISSVDGHPVRDLIDWQWYADGDAAALTTQVDGEEREVGLRREQGEGWGVEFGSAVFDSVRTCRNDCAFCFMAQLPPGLRSSLYLRDDDYRLSFLSGNFITLTNLSDEDVETIIERRLSPLYVSLHAVDPVVRAELVCPRVADRALEFFDTLNQAGIELHVQIVLVPAVNDGSVLEDTLAWLAGRDAVASVGVVPVGYTRFNTQIDESFTRTSAAAAVLAQVQAWQLRRRASSDTSWVHVADEFYISAGAPFPAAEWYDGFPQLENGIGLVRTFVDEIIGSRDRLEAAISALPADAESITVVTGMLAATTLGGALEACGGTGRIRILAVPNRFFGGNVSVSGLLTGIDMVEALQHDGRGIYVIPSVLFNADGLTLDGMTRAELGARVAADVRIVSPDGAGLLDALHL